MVVKINANTENVLSSHVPVSLDQCNTDNRFFGSRHFQTFTALTPSPSDMCNPSKYPTLVCGVDKSKRNDPQASSIPACSIYIILLNTILGTHYIFTPCSMMHPTIKMLFKIQYNSRVPIFLCTAATHCIIYKKTLVHIVC